MGSSCGKLDKEDCPDLQHEKTSESSRSRLHKKLLPTHSLHQRPLDHHHQGARDMPYKKDLVTGAYAEARSTRADASSADAPPFYKAGGTLPPEGKTPEDAEAEYFKDREEIANRQWSLSFDYDLTTKASDLERRAKERLDIVRANDEIAFYQGSPPLRGYGGQKHPRFGADHFLTNADLMEQTGLFHITTRMPKGAHLHIHFNSCLLPNVLLDIAEKMDNMFISSNVPLTTPDNVDGCEIQFQIINVTDDKQKAPVKASKKSNLFSEDYEVRAGPGQQSKWMPYWMPYREFREQWKIWKKKWEEKYDEDCEKEWQDESRKGHIKEEDKVWQEKWKKKHMAEYFAYDRFETSKKWLISKIVYSEEEAHNPCQTSEGAWDKFNGRTRMMKGLFNYETAYREYTQKCLEEFQNDGVQYAEIRPNFMKTNQIWVDDGTKQLDNPRTVEVIIEEWNKFKGKYPDTKVCGLKVIYCTPRSFPPGDVWIALQECLTWKKGPFKDYIAGFDLVGEETKGKPLRAFIPQFLAWKRQCQADGVEIPLLLHCGETLECGGETDGNLLDAVLLGAKRIGHGFALPRNPYLVKKFKDQNICVEVCPISNEVLGLTPRVNGHAMYELLANDVHCTVNSDNGTLFRSTLSHDFYQVMQGSKKVNLHGWRQLIEWSIEHASLTDDERKKVYDTWHGLWIRFVSSLVETLADIKPIDRSDPEGGKKWRDRVTKLRDEDFGQPEDRRRVRPSQTK